MIDLTKIDTTIYVSGFAIHQPVTVFTDYLIAIVSFCFSFLLNTSAFKDEITINWKRFFLLLSIASFLGGCSHGFFAIHDGAGYKLFWLPMQALNIIAVYCAQQATLFSTLKNPDKKNFWKWSYKIQLLIFFVAVFIFQNFIVVVIDTTIGMLPIMIIHFLEAKKTNSSAWVAYGILVLCFAAVVNATKFSFHVYFNYLDISHILIIIQLSFMFIGINQKAKSTIVFSKV